MPTADMPEPDPQGNELPKSMNVQGVQLDVTRTLVITGLRDHGQYAVVLKGAVRLLPPRLLERLCTLAWYVYRHPPQGWWHYKAGQDEANAVYKNISRLRDALEDKDLVESDRGGCYRLVLPWHDIQWHVDSLRSVVDEDLNTVLRHVMTVLDVAPPPVDDDAFGQ